MQQTETKNQTLTILCATSLYYPLQKVQSDFEKAYPNINVEIQPHGSIQVIRQVTEENETADLIMVADYSLIPAMMYNADVPGTNQGFADYYIRFASNSMVLAYTNRSQYADDINSTNWYSILTQPNVKIGLVNPELDSLGYRSLIAIQLASSYYGDPELFHDLITNNFNPPIDCIANGSNYVITIPTTQQPSGDKITLRASEVDLIPLLQEDYLDYCFLYLSNAKQYNFSYISLPDQINLGSTQYDENYSQVQVIYAHQRFTQITLDRTGEAIYYGMTIPTNAPNPELATLFMQFILNGQGKNDFAQSWQPILTPSFTDNLQLIPNSLQPYVAKDPLPVNYIS
ncbi:MAG TPA: tungstate ABC transporter substrate-binding protein WtpA [archaeon]|nr:tungstate ABC transporter substrate-binding protein WtpA [archaeon]